MKTKRRVFAKIKHKIVLSLANIILYNSIIRRKRKGEKKNLADIYYPFPSVINFSPICQRDLDRCVLSGLQSNLFNTSRKKKTRRESKSKRTVNIMAKMSTLLLSFVGWLFPPSTLYFYFSFFFSYFLFIFLNLHAK